MMSKLGIVFLFLTLLGLIFGAPTIEEEEVVEEDDVGVDVRIRGGQKSAEQQFPFAVSLQQATNNNKFCTGAIIDTKWVLTAAHCFDEATEKDDMRCFAGAVDGQDYTGDDSQIIKIAKFFIHKDYDKNNEDSDKGDIALVKLSRPFQLSKTVQPATLPPKGYKLANDGIVFGWGATTRTQEEPSRYLKHTTLNVIDDSKCKAVFQGYGDRQFCAIGSSPNAACQGDSGGPLMQITKEGVPYIAGVVSFGSVDCGTGPTVFTKVSDYLDFIETTRKNN